MLATEFGNEIDNDGQRTGRVNGQPGYVRRGERDLASIDEVAPRGVAAGPRYDEQGMRTVNV